MLHNRQYTKPLRNGLAEQPPLTILVISEDPFNLAALSDKLSRDRKFSVIKLNNPEYATDLVDRYRPEVIVTDVWYNRLGQECWPVVENLVRRRPLTQVVVVDNVDEDAGSKAMTAHGLITLPQALAKQGSTLANYVYSAAVQARGDRDSCRRRVAL